MASYAEKGMKDKIMDKLPGAHKQQTHTTTTKDKIMDKLPGGGGHKQKHTHTTTPVTGGYGTTTTGGKGIKDKIMDQLPGGHKQQTHTTTGGSYGTTGGMVEKIKEKLPGGHKTHH